MSFIDCVGYHADNIEIDLAFLCAFLSPDCFHMKRIDYALWTQSASSRNLLQESI